MCSHESHLPEDCLSSLPDDILLFILSSLTFKEVVKTSLFSRRWLNLWIHSLVLHFHAPVPEDKYKLITDRERENYVKWVNRVLLRHKGQFLKEFEIVCALDKRNQKDIDNWLVVAFAKKVQCLELNLMLPGLEVCNLSDNYVFPGPFLNCSGKSQFDFKCLKSLTLKRVEVSGEGINFFLLNCPFLERLEVVGSSTLVNLVISDPTLVLKYLKIKYCHDLKVLSISNLNLVSLDISSVSSVGNITLTGLPMLVELSISGSLGRLSHSIPQASSCFPQLEALMLDGLYLKDATQLCNYSRLAKLKRLVISFGAYGDESLTKLISIVNSCPLLEEFVLTLRWFKPERIRRPIFKVERCISSLNNESLKVFEFTGYYGRFSDVELIMHVVKNAVVLEKIIIDPRNGRLIDLLRPTTRQEEEARSIALQQYDILRESIPPHVHLHIR